MALSDSGFQHLDVTQLCFDLCLHTYFEIHNICIPGSDKTMTRTTRAVPIYIYRVYVYIYIGSDTINSYIYRVRHD